MSYLQVMREWLDRNTKGTLKRETGHIGQPARWTDRQEMVLEGRTMRILAPGLQKVPSEGCQNGSAVTGTCCLAKQPEFDALNSHGRRN